MNGRLLSTGAIIASMWSLTYIVTIPDLPFASVVEELNPKETPAQQVAYAHWDLVESYCNRDVEGMLEIISDQGLFSPTIGDFLGRDTIRTGLAENLKAEKIPCDEVTDVASYSEMELFSRRNAMGRISLSGSSLFDEVQEGGFKIQSGDIIATIPLMGQTKKFLLGVYRGNIDDGYKMVLLR